MPKYLIQASYTTEGVQGLLSDGGSARTEAAAAAGAVAAGVERVERVPQDCSTCSSHDGL